MGLKSMPYPFGRDESGGDSALVAPWVLEPVLRRVAGDGPINLFRAKAEVDAALWAGAGTLPEGPPLADALPPAAVPSVGRSSSEDRVLAEIDQDGFTFAKDPLDAPFFNRRSRR